MKLFVVGENSPDPAKWSIWSEWHLVIAPDSETAIRMCASDSPATEIPMDKALHLVKMPEPAHGDDL